MTAARRRVIVNASAIAVRRGYGVLGTSSWEGISDQCLPRERKSSFRSAESSSTTAAAIVPSGTSVTAHRKPWRIGPASVYAALGSHLTRPLHHAWEPASVHKVCAPGRPRITGREAYSNPINSECGDGGTPNEHSVFSQVDFGGDSRATGLTDSVPQFRSLCSSGRTRRSAHPVRLD